MIKAIKLSVVLGLLIVLLIPTSFPQACDSGPRVSHVCVPTGSQQTIALVVWPGAPHIPANATGSLTVSWSGGTFSVPLTYVHTNGITAKWTGVVPSEVSGSKISGSMVVTAGWVLGTSHTIENLPYTFEFGKLCTPTAVELNSLSASSQNHSPIPLALTLVLMAVGLVVVKRF